MRENIKATIEKELNELLNQPLIDIGRASNLLWLSFGEKVITLDRHGCEKFKNKFALNIQCSWRLTEDDRIIVASKDIYYPRIDLNGDDFEWDTVGSNRFDEKINEFKKRIESNILVFAISADKFGGLKVSFNTGLQLELFPDDSLEDEFWRFIVFGEKSKHYVIFDKV